MLIITKCPAFDSFDQKDILKNCEHLGIPVFFSRYTYRPLTPLTYGLNELNKVLVISAIADPVQLLKGLPQHLQVEQMQFADHHAYTKEDIKAIHHFFDTFANEQTALVTTSKDWIKIKSLLNEEERQKYPWYLLTFELEWLDQNAFNQFISAYVVSN
ncbi:MAG: hypothetical protein EB003_03700 [Flavobacteriia bacterium]|nr:hypothetical protein [Flavobacteriia bacterium]